MRRAVCAIAIAAAACGPPSAGPIVQRLVDQYAPGLPIGERLPDETRTRYKLRAAAYAGYADDAFEGPDGVSGLVILMNPSPDDGVDEQIPGWARIRGVTLAARTPAIVARVDARFRASMGTPTIQCYKAGFGEKVEIRFWPAERGRGVLLRVWGTRPGSAPPSGDHPADFGSADITFGAQPVSPDRVTFEPCS